MINVEVDEHDLVALLTFCEVRLDLHECKRIRATLEAALPPDTKEALDKTKQVLRSRALP